MIVFMYPYLQRCFPQHTVRKARRELPRLARPRAFGQRIRRAPMFVRCATHVRTDQTDGHLGRELGEKITAEEPGGRVPTANHVSPNSLRYRPCTFG